MEAPVQKALEVVGDRNRYQYLAFAILFLYNGFSNLMMVGPTFIFMNPLFICQGYDTLLGEADACPIIDKCTIESDFTITARLQLYCDKQEQRDAVQFILLVGSFFGSFLVNFASEAKGRKFALLGALFCGTLGMTITLIGAQFYIYPLMLVGQFFCGICAFPLIVQTFIYCYEIAEDVLRQRALVAINYAWALTYSLIGVLYYVWNYWFDYLLFISIIPMIITWIISYFFLVEGPNYLYRMEQIERCKDSLAFIAKINGTTEEYDKISASFKFQVDPAAAQQEEPSMKQSFKECSSNMTYIRMVVVLCLTQIGCNLYYWGNNYAYDQIGYAYGANCIIAGIIECLGYLTLNLTIEKLPRKKSLLILYSLLAAIGFLFYIKPLQDSNIGSTIVLSVIRYIVTLEFTLVMIFMTECFPSHLTAICTGIIEALAQIGGILGPVTINISIRVQVYPMIILSFVGVGLILLPFIFMVEPPSPGEKLPDDDTQISEEAKRDSDQPLI